MAIIWGLDLKEMQWGKFKSGYMWNDVYHRRKTKFIVYQLAMILCVVSESLGTAALSKYVDAQKAIESISGPRQGRTTLYQNDIVGAFSFNIFVGVYVATIFGSAFFFDLFWPERHESQSVRIAWKICSVLACVFTLASAIEMTVILATHRAKLIVNGNVVTGGPGVLSVPLAYKDNSRALAAVILMWPGWLATIASTYLLWKSLAYIDQHGPFSKAGRAKDPELVSTEPKDEVATAATAQGNPHNHHQQEPSEAVIAAEAETKAVPESHEPVRNV